MDKFLSSLVGKPYHQNDYSGEGFDCYSLIYYIYKHYGIEIPKYIINHNVRVLNKEIKQNLPLWQVVAYSDRKFLDVLLFNTTKRLRVHVGIVINSKLFMHAIDEDSVVIRKFKSSLYIAKLHKVYRWHTL